MKIEVIKCDKCGKVCYGDYFSIYRHSEDRVIGKSDICCYDPDEGYSLEERGDWDGVIAWMPKPEPYKEDTEVE